MYLQGDINHCSNPAVACPNWNQQISHTKILHHCYSLCMTYAFYCDVWMEIYKAFLTQIDDLRRFHQAWNPTQSCLVWCQNNCCHHRLNILILQGSILGEGDNFIKINIVVAVLQHQYLYDKFCEVVNLT